MVHAGREAQACCDAAGDLGTFVLTCVHGEESWRKSESEISKEINRRRTFAIISHPDAGKTTLTEKLLLFGGAIQMAGTVKGRKATRHATSDWMRLEQQRGISVTSSVMQFPFEDCIVNLLDTPGHEDFSEDTYRTLTAVDSALMVIDCAKGVEERTIKLMEVCRLRDTPIMTFVNKLDRDGRAPIELLDEIESVLKIQCAPLTWPIGMGRDLLGVYHLLEDRIYVYVPVEKGRAGSHETIEGLASAEARDFLGERYAQFLDEAELVRGASPAFDLAVYRAARQTPVFFGSAVNNFGVAGAAPLLRPLFARTTAARRAAARGRGHGAEAHGIRLQDPGQHGPRTSRPHRVHAPVLGPLRARHAPASRAARQGRPRGRCADLPCGGSQSGRGGLCGRHHRSAQSRHDQHRRYLQRGRASHLHGRAEFRAGDLPPRRAQGSAAHEGAAERPRRSFARKARRSCSSRCATTT